MVSCDGSQPWSHAGHSVSGEAILKDIDAVFMTTINSEEASSEISAAGKKWVHEISSENKFLQQHVSVLSCLYRDLNMSN